MSDTKRIDHRAYIASLTSNRRADLLDMLLDILPSKDGALEGAEELVWLVEHIAAASPLMDAAVQIMLERHRDDVPISRAEQKRIEQHMQEIFDEEWGEMQARARARFDEMRAAERAEERTAKRREWWRSLWARLVGRR